MEYRAESLTYLRKLVAHVTYGQTLRTYDILQYIRGLIYAADEIH